MHSRAVWGTETMEAVPVQGNPGTPEYMTLEEVLEAIDSLKPNSYGRGEKVAWLSSLDGQLYRELVPIHEGQCEAFSPYGLGDGGRKLFVPEPYGRELYLAYLENRMDHYNGDTVRYNNSLDRLALLYRDFSRWYNRTHRPLGGKRKYW